MAEKADVIFPIIGSDKRFLNRGDLGEKVPVGGKFVYGKNPGIWAIQEFSINLKDGDRLGIIGHNGSGKTTLLRLLAGIYPPSAGKLEIIGKTTGMFSLTLGLNKNATGLQNIKFKGLIQGIPSSKVDEMIPEIATFSELGDYLYLPVKTYSSGMVMRLMFATASFMKPDILLLDEWVSAGDKSFKRKVDEKLEEMLETTPIVIIASHNENRVKTWANRVIELHQGKATQL